MSFQMFWSMCDFGHGKNDGHTTPIDGFDKGSELPPVPIIWILFYKMNTKKESI